MRGGRRRMLTPKTAFHEVFSLHRFLPFLPSARLNLNEEKLPTSMMPIEATSGAFMFLSAHEFGKLKGFDEDYFLHVEDLDLCLRFARMGGKIWFEPAIEVFHQGSTSDVSSNFIERHKAVGFSKYFRKNFADELPAFVFIVLDMAIWLRFAIRSARFYIKEKLAR